MPDPEQSLITDAHRALVGVKGEPIVVEVREADARRTRGVLEDGDPRFADGTGIAPGYVIACLSGRPPAMPQIFPGILLTQQEWRFTRPFRVGERLTAVSQVLDIRERLGGRRGFSVLITTGTDYYDEGGGHVAASMVTLTQFDPGAKPE